MSFQAVEKRRGVRKFGVLEEKSSKKVRFLRQNLFIILKNA